MIITRLPLPEQLTQIERFFWQLELTSRRSLSVAMFRNNAQQNNKADSPSVLINKPCLPHSLHCSHPHSSPLLWDSQQTVCKAKVFGSNETLGHIFTWFQMLFCYWSFHCSQILPFSLSISLSQSPFPACSHFSSSSPFFKSPFLALIFFLSCFPVGFFSPFSEGPFCSTVATQSGSAVWAEALGKRSVRQKRGEKKRGRRRRRNHCKVAD